MLFVSRMVSGNQYSVNMYIIWTYPGKGFILYISGISASLKLRSIHYFAMTQYIVYKGS